MAKLIFDNLHIVVEFLTTFGEPVKFKDLDFGDRMTDYFDLVVPSFFTTEELEQALNTLVIALINTGKCDRFKESNVRCWLAIRENNGLSFDISDGSATVKNKYKYNNLKYGKYIIEQNIFDGSTVILFMKEVDKDGKN